MFVENAKTLFFVVFFYRVAQRKVDVDSLLSCSPSALPSGLSVVRDPTTGMLLDFTEVMCWPLLKSHSNLIPSCILIIFMQFLAKIKIKIKTFVFWDIFSADQQ